jgi:hypothetical protein
VLAPKRDTTAGIHLSTTTQSIINPDPPHHSRRCGTPHIQTHPQNTPPSVNCYLHHHSRVKPWHRHIKSGHRRVFTSITYASTSPTQTLPGDVNLDHIQINDSDEEAKEEADAGEEEELTRVQQEIERLRQEQESILRRKVAIQCAEARRQNINREQERLAEMQYNLYMLEGGNCQR